jgi:hypothetical protein
VQVKNVGNTLAKGTASVAFYLSADATLDASDPLLAVAMHSLHLKAGQGTTFTAAVAPLPPGTTIGGYFLFAVVTPGAGIRENNTANNAARSAQRVAVVETLPAHDHHQHHHDGSGDAIVFDTTTVIAVDCGCADTADQNIPDNAPPPDTGPSTAPAEDNSPPPDTAPSTAQPDSSSSSDTSSSSTDTPSDSSGGDF